MFHTVKVQCSNGGINPEGLTPPNTFQHFVLWLAYPYVIHSKIRVFLSQNYVSKGWNNNVKGRRIIIIKCVGRKCTYLKTQHLCNRITKSKVLPQQCYLTKLLDINNKTNFRHFFEFSEVVRPTCETGRGWTCIYIMRETIGDPGE